MLPAPGPWPAPTTRLLAVLGAPIAHSRSPAIHNPMLRARGLDRAYLALEVGGDDLAAALPVLHRLPFDGLNLTTPLKEVGAGLCDRLDPVAARLGAVNTLVREPRGWRGLSTDGPGLLLFLQEVLDLDPGGARVVVLGAGGAARSALLALFERGPARLSVVTRDPGRFQGGLLGELAAEGVVCRTTADPQLGQELADADLLIHATPYGLGGDPGEPPWDLGAVGRHTRVLDMNYRAQGPTPFLARLGPRPLALDGRGMLAGQAVLAFEAWFGERPPVAEALRAFEAPAPQPPRHP